MPLKIRLSRGGNKKRPHYRVVLADSRAPRDGRFIERLGTYNPILSKDNDQRVILNEERIKHWLKNGAQPTDRVTKFLSDLKIIKDIKRDNPNKAKPKAKAQERAQALIDAKLAAEEEKIKEKAAEAAPAAEETPAAEVAPAAEETPAAKEDKK
ncbi:MAG: 30S ribosomal protein S16 [Pelagibacterales bacterium]|nr:30S ribosomal protein S16 [Pelagibacterales bacterium]